MSQTSLWVNTISYCHFAHKLLELHHHSPTFEFVCSTGWVVKKEKEKGKT